ncbi:MAG: RNA 2',3'-cyclic phosphodiesterase [Rhodospirillaceae bacterium]|jgi:2'-5' RNA ligase|nr:RNA 2',3'-cyclic phosphodiesterase [Rhodospirillaceae bacterium]MBT6402878.1 RNA 2',3'-cyclic phosphodiesterase [Rhodospirillaceae bacterium]MBT6535770.1 RNA 2',3'-cyclic phosphodiesterase [Rhodospirillaceae bacterium]MBT7360412.1 RNA 2',3'-cyclic phosphodiesterase [Rhodospirillaceae bacterium]
MIRLFVGISLPEILSERLTGLRGQIPGARWVPPENHHITLRFIGEVDEETAADLDAALARIDAPPFEVAMSGVGHFESRGLVRALWVGVERDPALDHLQARVETACQRAGLAPEGRKFHPHVTLARCRDTRTARIAGFLADHGGFRAPPFPVGSFALYSSILGRGGAIYTRETDYPLGRP